MKSASVPLAAARCDNVTIRTLAIIAFGGYVAWNAAWLLNRHVPPSIFMYCTGLPCPTTGMTRSLLALCHGDLRDFFLFNPFTLGYLTLAGISVVTLFHRYIRGATFVLPGLLGWSWLVFLVLGFAAKFAIGKQYW